jgi:hypothetical protein
MRRWQFSNHSRIYMANQIMAADKSRLKSQFGILSKADMRLVEDAIRVHHLFFLFIRFKLSFLSLSVSCSIQCCGDKSFIGQGSNYTSHQIVTAEANGVLARPLRDGLQHLALHQFSDLIGALGG